MSLHSNESKREEYHRYLEKSGVIEYFTQVLVNLYETPEKPLDPNEFIRVQLSKFFPDDTDELRKQIEAHEVMIIERENILGELRQENFELYAALKAHGVNIDKIDSDDEENDFDEARRKFRTETEGEPGEDDVEDDESNNNFGFDRDDFIPKFKYHQGSNDELEGETGFETNQTENRPLTIDTTDQNDNEDTASQSQSKK